VTTVQKTHGGIKKPPRSEDKKEMRFTHHQNQIAGCRRRGKNKRIRSRNKVTHLRRRSVM